jgi:uncharacterized protein (DUF433 family)
MNLVGVGLYTVADAARITRAPAREVRRWMFGYRYRPHRGAEPVYSEPLWASQVEQPGAIGFHDLLELRVVKEFTKRGVHLPVIRAAIRNARELFGTNYPLTRHRFLTDGKRVFHDAIEAESPLTDMAARQIVFEEIIRPSLYAGIEYGPDGAARRWYPVPRSNVIVLDPAISFGAPVLADYGIPVDTIVAALAGEGNAGIVANIFGIPRAAVLAAARYEHRLAA